MSINHNQKIRRALRSGLNSNLRIVSDFGRVDTVETSKDPLTRAPYGFKCHKGNIEAHFFFERANHIGFVEKKLHLINYIGTDCAVVWLYNLKAHDFKKYLLFISGNLYREYDGKEVVLPYFTKKEWQYVAITLLDYINSVSDKLKDMGHAPLSKKNLLKVVPKMRTMSPVQDTSAARFSALRQHQANSENNTGSVSESVTYDDAYWVHHSKQETPHGAKPDPFTVKLSGTDKWSGDQTAIKRV